METQKILCDGCNVRKPWEHRCHGQNCDCDHPICMEKQGKISQSELIKIIKDHDKQTEKGN